MKRKTPPPKPKQQLGMRAVAAATPAKRNSWIEPPELPRGVVPPGRTSAVAMDYASTSYAYEYANQVCYGTDAMFQPFPGYPYLARLATRAEYMQLASTIATELTREWIKITYADEDDTGRVAELEDAIRTFGLRDAFHTLGRHDALYGRAQIFIDAETSDRNIPLILDPRTFKAGSLRGFATVEASWTTPSNYNALDPASRDFYKPQNWFMMGQEVSATRLLTIVTRPLPDMLKPAYNFGGLSLSQMAEPYVTNWLRTRQAVSDLVNNFSILSLSTTMDQVLQGNDDGASVFARADFFTATKSNRGVMVIDKETESLEQLAIPLGGLSDLQAQAQEHMCSVSRIPAPILTGISPKGMNASSEGEIRIFYDWISAQQEAFWRPALDRCLKCIQLHLWGEVDDRIGFAYNPLWQMSKAEEAKIHLDQAAADWGDVDRGIINPEEVRKKRAISDISGWDGILDETD